MTSKSEEFLSSFGVRIEVSFSDKIAEINSLLDVADKLDKIYFHKHANDILKQASAKLEALESKA